MSYKSSKKLKIFQQYFNFSSRYFITTNSINNGSVSKRYPKVNRFKKKFKNSNKSNVKSFQQLKVASHLWSILPQRLNIEYPSKIQEITIPYLNEIEKKLIPNDLIIRSETGSGKTLAYLLPLLSTIQRKSNIIQKIIIAPTKELSLQIYKVANVLNKGGKGNRKKNPVRIMRLIGSTLKKSMLKSLETLPPHIIITTPQIFYKLLKLESSSTLMDGIDQIICDEIDFMLQIHSKSYILSILDYFFSFNKNPKTINQTSSQLIFVSATIDYITKQIAGKYMRKIIYISAEGNDYIVNKFKPDDDVNQLKHLVDYSLAPTIKHYKIYLDQYTKERYHQELILRNDDQVVTDDEKISTDLYKLKLLRQLHAALKPRVLLIFLSNGTLYRLQQLIKEMSYYSSKKFTYAFITNSSTKKERYNALKLAKLGRLTLLFCTDMASRGLDIQGITHVINFDIPNDNISYLHRAGRIGRLGGYKYAKYISIVEENLTDYAINEQAESLQIDLYQAYLEHGQFKQLDKGI